MNRLVSIYKDESLDGAEKIEKLFSICSSFSGRFVYDRKYFLSYIPFEIDPYISSPNLAVPVTGTGSHCTYLLDKISNNMDDEYDASFLCRQVNRITNRRYRAIIICQLVFKQSKRSVYRKFNISSNSLDEMYVAAINDLKKLLSIS